MALSAAVPSHLIGFSGWAKQQDREVMAMARKINHAIDGFNAMPQNPRYIGPLPYIGDDLASLSAGMSAVDEWVGKVGHAFEQAANQGTGTSSGDQWRSVQDATLTAAVTTPPPPTVQPGPSPAPLPTAPTTTQPNHQQGGDVEPPWLRYILATEDAGAAAAAIIGGVVLIGALIVLAPETFGLSLLAIPLAVGLIVGGVVLGVLSYKEFTE